jgi:hypothetical protein
MEELDKAILRFDLALYGNGWRIVLTEPMVEYSISLESTEFSITRVGSHLQLDLQNTDRKPWKMPYKLGKSTATANGTSLLLYVKEISEGHWKDTIGIPAQIGIRKESKVSITARTNNDGDMVLEFRRAQS